MNNIFIGSEFKLNVSIEPISDFTMDDYDFKCEFWCYSNRKVTIEKKDMSRQDENNYIARLDSRLLGSGELKCMVTAYIPDSDFDDGYRTEVVCVDTNCDIVKSL